MFGGIAAAGAERLVYATAEGVVVTFDLETGKVAGQFGCFPLGPEEVRISSCAVDADRTILLGDTRNRCVRRFRADGLLLKRYGELATLGIEEQDEPGVFSDPCAILPVDEELFVACGGLDFEFGVQRVGERPGHLVHPEGGWRRAHGLARVGDEVWVAETEDGAILRFHLDGRFIDRAPLPEELTKPFRLAFDGYEGVLALFLPEADSEQEQFGVARLSLDGECEGWAVEAGEEGGRVYCPFDLAVMPDGRFVVADLPIGVPPDVRLQLFSADGRLLKTIMEDRIDLDRAIQEWTSARRTEGDAYERGLVGRDPALLRQALERDPGHLLARLHLARLLDPAEAEVQFRLAAEHGADPGDIAARIAECRKAAGDLDGAIEILRAAVEGEHLPEDYYRWVEELGTWFLERAEA